MWRSASGRACELLCRGGPCPEVLLPCHGLTRRPLQVASHAQKYFLKLEASRGKKARVAAAPEPVRCAWGRASLFCVRARRCRRR